MDERTTRGFRPRALQSFQARHPTAQSRMGGGEKAERRPNRRASQARTQCDDSEGRRRNVAHSASR
eukprot:7389343-Alexandrium_andersonii.AAC.1